MLHYIQEAQQPGLGHIVMLKLSTESAHKLAAWCKRYMIPCMDPKHMHLTLITTTEHAPELLQLDNTSTHVTAQPMGWQVLGASSLVLKVHAPQAEHMHDKILSTGVEHKFPDFIPHVSVNYHTTPERSLPDQVPVFELVFDRIHASAVDPYFAIKTD